MENPNFKTEFEKLNFEQKQVVEQVYGPVMVVAGPGTGKTQIIALRTANIILQTDVNPENILITTFTDAGVIAIKKRLAKFIGTDAYKVKVSTFHSFAKEVIDDFPEKFLEHRAEKNIDDIESYEILSEILDKNISSGNIKELFTVDKRFVYLRDIKDRIGKLKTEGVSVSDFEKIIKKQNQEYEQKLLDLENNKRIRDLEKRRSKDKKDYDKQINKLKELALIYKEYNNIIRKKGLYDFADMINFVTEKFKTDEGILSYYAEKFQFMMIDEFQDTNNSQNNIVDTILNYFPEEQNIMVVGDDDQSIYRFQGANIENMLNFNSKYKDRKTIVLTKNYRSSQSILDLSKNLIENNTGRISNKDKDVIKDLEASGENKNLTQNNFYSLENEIKEKLFVFNKITQLINAPLNKGSCPKDLGVCEENFAIIVKTNKQVEEWSSFLEQKGLKVNSKNSSNILNNHYCNLILNFLKFIENPYFDDSCLIDLLRSDLVDIENIDVIYMSRILYQKNYCRNKWKLGLWDIIKDIENPPLSERGNRTVDFKDINKIIEFRDLISKLTGNLGNFGINSILKEVIESLNIFEYIENNGSFDDLQDIFSLVNKIKNYIENNNKITLKNILNKFELYEKYNVAITRESIKKSNSNIEILTAHSSKGLEYDHVFIPGVYEGNWNKRKPADKLKLPIGFIGEGLQYKDLSEKEIKSLEKEIATEEERRLFFVAITRAKKSLIFTIPESKENKVLLQSKFILETECEPEKYELETNEDELKEILTSSVLETSLIKTGEDEINYISSFLENYKLSPTDFNKFLNDPKIFLREVIFKYPFLSNENLMFGSAYHKVLEIAEKNKIDGILLKLQEMQDLFLKEIKKYDLSLEEFERLKERGNNGLAGYYDIFKENPREVIRLEYNFRSKNVLFGEVPLTGKIDKIEIINNTTSNENTGEELGQQTLFKEKVSLVDFKTGKIKTIGVIKGLDKYGNKKESGGDYFRQLLFYKLMFENCSELNSRYDVGELALDFVEGKEGEYKYTRVDYECEDYEEFKELIKDSWEKINNINFWKELLN